MHEDNSDILIVRVDDFWWGKAKIDLASKKIAVSRILSTETYDLSHYSHITLHAEKNPRIGLHIVATHWTPGGYTDHPVILRGDKSVPPLVLGNPDVEYSKAFKFATELAEFTGLTLYDNTVGIILPEKPPEEPWRYKDIPVSPTPPSYIVTGAHLPTGGTTFQLPFTRLTLVGHLVFASFFAVDIAIPFYIHDLITTTIPTTKGFLLNLAFMSYAPVVVVPAYYLAKRLYTRVSVTILEREVIIERKFITRNTSRIKSNDIKKVSLYYSPRLQGIYANNILFNMKKTPPILIKTRKEKVRIGAGLDFSDLLYMALQIRQLEDRNNEVLIDC